MQFSSGRRRHALPAIVAVALSLVAPSALPRAAFAQDDTATAAPSSVARIDALGGDVAIQRGDDNATLAAAPNAPVLDGDYVTTGPDGRAEVGFDGRSALRIGANAQLRLVNVDPANRQIQLAAGTVELRLFGDTDGRSGIDTPSVSIVPRTAGSFRIAVDANGETSVSVRAGRVDVETPQGDQSLEPGTTLVAGGPAANPSIQTQRAIALDDFDAYNSGRDQIYLAATAEGQYVNTNIAGIGDLNGSGNWVDDGSYGYVWMPTNVAPGWAPYRNGNWTWEDGFGWTWVAAELWGWAPYHYGRWYFSPAFQRWAWYPPGPGRFAPAWSPALVGFVGFDVGAVGIGAGFGNIGWVPLAPYEAFHPWWGPHATALVSNVAINLNYRNFAVAGALTSVSRENFQRGRFGNPMVPTQEQLRSIHPVAMQGALPVVPTPANLRFSQRSVAPSLALRPALINRAFAGRPAAAIRTPFSEQQASVARVTHVAYRPAATYATGTPSNDPWQRYNGNRNAALPAYAQPQYHRPAAPAYAQPQYSRQAAPAYSRQAAPAYSRQAAPASHPQARPTHADDGHNR